MRYDYFCPADPEHPVIEVEHSMKDDPEILCEVCKEVMKRKFVVPLMMGRTPDPPGMIMDYLDYNRKRKKAGMPRYSPYKIKRPPE